MSLHPVTAPAGIRSLACITTDGVGDECRACTSERGDIASYRLSAVYCILFIPQEHRLFALGRDGVCYPEPSHPMVETVTFSSRPSSWEKALAAHATTNTLHVKV